MKENISVKSPEFARAWRIVSEALLGLIQNGGLDDLIGAIKKPDIIEPEEYSPIQETEPIFESPIEERKKVRDVRYAVCPLKRREGGYILKNLKETKQDESTFKITRYMDDTCDIEICELTPEDLQILKDNIKDRLPDEVGIVSGEITKDKRVRNIKPGKGLIVGKSIKIIEPLEAEFV